ACHVPRLSPPSYIVLTNIRTSTALTSEYGFRYNSQRHSLRGASTSPGYQPSATRQTSSLATNPAGFASGLETTAEARSVGPPKTTDEPRSVHPSSSHRSA